MKRSNDLHIGYNKDTGEWSIALSPAEARYITDTLRGAMQWTADNTSRFAQLFEERGYLQGYGEITKWAQDCVHLHKKLLAYAIFIENYTQGE